MNQIHKKTCAYLKKLVFIGLLGLTKIKPNSLS